MCRHNYTWILCIATTSCLATTLRVPGDYPTIQAAFDSLNDGDTVLVQSGIYGESLQAPNRSFVLLGVVNPGGDPEKPVVDPSPLEGSTHLACLTLPSQCRAVIQDFIFRNGPQMFPREHSGDVGGIANNAADLIIRDCVFDSTYAGVMCPIGTMGTLTVFDCMFNSNVRGCLRDRSPSRTSIFNSSFSAYGDRALWLNDSAVVENCQFHDMHDSGEWIWLEGRGIIVRNCDFGPTTAPSYAIIWTSSSRGCIFEQNIFHDLEVTGSVIWFNGIPDDTTYFRNNLFRRNRGVQTPGAGAAIFLTEQQDSLQSPNVIVSDNVFDSCWAAFSDGFGSVGMGPFNNWLERNIFVGPNIGRPNVHVFQVDTNVIANATIHQCSFNQTGWALRSDRFINAVLNWWGDPTGPHHSLNPPGLGDSIQGPVSFEPWLTEDPFWAASQPVAPVPSTARLEVYPNPFNATATLYLVVDRPGVYDVELYNTLGQRVLKLWSGFVSDQKQIALDGQALASGLYFARVRQLADHRTSALAKIVLLK